MFEFKLPDLGEGIHEGEILKWHVAEGGTVAEDAPLVDVETDKAAVTIPAPRGGKVRALRGKVGDIINVGDVVVVIDDGSGDTAAAADAAADAVFAEPDRPETTPAPEAAAPAAQPGVRRPVAAAPATRRLARQLKIDINLVAPSGPGGRVTPEDVHRFAERGAHAAPAKAAPAAVPAAAAAEHVAARQVRDESAFAEFAAHASATIPFLELEPLPDFSTDGPVRIEALRSIRRKVARKMVTSMALVPHVAHMDEADVTELDAFRRRERERRKGGAGGNLTLLAFVMKAVTAGLRATPAFNASLDPFREEIIYKDYYNIGFAADTGRGLIVPVVRGTDRKSIVQLADDVFDLATKAREGTLGAEHMRGGTFTITN
ncbi:MAG TPA: dihydrolipoamide acetyltransferase family protein, partial [Candidatus Krumholzibacteria bacterium]|nr:dihydrolipoamide acetyltransferase family protein [Candidatus Krumholzibacteria bacterium]